MRQHVTVIPSDRLISVDGMPLWFDFAAPKNMHALQWHEGHGHVEYTDGSTNAPLSQTDYAQQIQPFIALWEAEQARLEILAAVPPAPPTPEEQQAMFTAAIQAHLDAFARTRNYDGILSATTYATSSVPKFLAEGQYAVEARDSTWATAYEILGAVLSGMRPMPESIDDVLADLPTLTWPEV